MSLLHLCPLRQRRHSRIGVALPLVPIVRQQQRITLGPAWNDGDLVFPGPLGNPYPARDLSRRFAAIVRTAGLPPLRFHNRRHTAATFMLL